MSSIDTCWTCGNSAIEERERIALAVQKRHDDGSDFNKEWSNHHGLDRCDCAELVEFIRGLDKTFWDGMNRSLEEAFQTNAEIYKECLDNEHAAVIILAEERWVPAICSKCIEKLEDFE